MKDTSSVRIKDKTPVNTKTITQSESMKLKDMTVEEKRLKLALDLRKF